MKNYIVCIVLCLGTQQLQAQFSANLELSQTIETQDKGVGIGASAQYLFTFNELFFPGANAGFMYDFGNGKEINSFSMPVLLMARYYVLGEHHTGGGYAEINAGAAFHFKNETLERESVTTYRFLPKATLGFGYRFPQGYDLNLHLNLDRVDKKTIPSLGVKFGYTF
jgi:hypothetical protein